MKNYLASRKEFGVFALTCQKVNLELLLWLVLLSIELICECAVFIGGNVIWANPELWFVSTVSLKRKIICKH